MRDGGERSPKTKSDDFPPFSRRDCSQIFMSKRLDQEREKRLTPSRMDTAVKALESRGYRVQKGDGAIFFRHKGKTITYHVYSGWASGKGIVDGRGLQRLLRQLDTANNVSPTSHSDIKKEQIP